MNSSYVLIIITPSTELESGESTSPGCPDKRIMLSWCGTVPLLMRLILPKFERKWHGGRFSHMRAKSAGTGRIMPMRPFFGRTPPWNTMSEPVATRLGKSPTETSLGTCPSEGQGRNAPPLHPAQCCAGLLFGRLVRLGVFTIRK